LGTERVWRGGRTRERKRMGERKRIEGGREVGGEGRKGEK